jgi:hypothetical protein
LVLSSRQEKQALSQEKARAKKLAAENKRMALVQFNKVD